MYVRQGEKLGVLALGFHLSAGPLHLGSILVWPGCRVRIRHFAACEEQPRPEIKTFI